ITTKRASALTQYTVLAFYTSLLDMYGLRLGKMCASCADDMSIFKMLVDRLPKIIFCCIQWIAWQKITVGERIQSIFVPRYPYKTFDVTVPRVNILISDRPIYRETVTCRPFEI